MRKAILGLICSAALALPVLAQNGTSTMDSSTATASTTTHKRHHKKRHVVSGQLDAKPGTNTDHPEQAEHGQIGGAADGAKSSPDKK